MNLPLTVSGTRVINGDNSVTVTITIKDSTNAVLFGPSASTLIAGAPASRVADVITEQLRNILNAQLSAADIPASFSIQYGLPATVRPIDLIV